MLKRQLGTLFLVTCLILTTVPAVLGSTSIDKNDVTNSGTQKSAEQKTGFQKVPGTIVILISLPKHGLPMQGNLEVNMELLTS